MLGIELAKAIVTILVTLSLFTWLAYLSKGSSASPLPVDFKQELNDCPVVWDENNPNQPLL